MVSVVPTLDMVSVVPTLDMLGSPAIGDHTLWLMTHTKKWVHRRVESVQFRDNSTVLRKISIDFTILDVMPKIKSQEGAVYRLVPLTVLNKRRLSNFSLRDEDNKSASMFNAVQNTAVAKAVLISAAAGALGCDSSEVPSSICQSLHSIAASRTVEERDRALNQRENSVGPELHGNAAFNHVADMFALGFIVIVLVANEMGARRIFKFSYEEPVDFASLPLGDRLKAALGWIPTRVRFLTPAVDAPESFHFEVGAPEGVDITEAALVVTRPEVNHAQREEPPPLDWARGGFPRAHLHPRGVPNGSWGEAIVSLRACRRGWLRFACFSICSIALILTLGGYWLWRVSTGKLPTPPTGTDPVLALFLAGPAILTTLLVRPSEHALAARLLLGIRVLLALIGLMMYGAAAAFVAFPFDRHLMRFWPWLSLPAFATALAALVSLHQPKIQKKDPRGQRATL